MVNMNNNGASRTQGALTKMWGQQSTGPKTNFRFNFASEMHRLILFTVLFALLLKTEVYADDNQQGANEIITAPAPTTEFGKIHHMRRSVDGKYSYWLYAIANGLGSRLVTRS